MGFIGDNWPYTNEDKINLDWVLKQVQNLQSNLSNFVSLNTVKYANPFEWNITSQYAANTVVSDPETNTVYLSVAAVPSGTGIDNTDYWVPVFTLPDIPNGVKNAITPVSVENGAAYSETLYPYNLIWIDNELYTPTAEIAAGVPISAGVNTVKTSVSGELLKLITNVDSLSNNLSKLSNYKIYANVVEYGADKTGENNSTDAFQSAINTGYIVFTPPGNYKINSEILKNTTVIYSPNTTIIDTNGSDPITYSAYSQVAYEDNDEKYAYFVNYREDTSTNTPPSTGWVKATSRTDTVVRSDNDFYNWSVLALLDNYSTSSVSENVAMYGQASARNDSKTWASCFEMRDYSNSPSLGKIGTEITFVTNGDDGNNRVGLDVAIHKNDISAQSEPAAITYGVRVAGENITDTITRNCFYAENMQMTNLLTGKNCTALNSCIDLSGITCLGSAITLAENQLLSMGPYFQIKAVGTNLLFTFQGTTVAYISTDGFHSGAPT